MPRAPAYPILKRGSRQLGPPSHSPAPFASLGQRGWRGPSGGLYTPEYAERMAMTVPPGVHLRRIPERQTLEGMLAAGALEGLVTGEQPRPFLAGSPSVRRLFPDYR